MSVTKELYLLLEDLIGIDEEKSDAYGHVPTSGLMDLLITGDSYNKAVDFLKEYKHIKDMS